MSKSFDELPIRIKTLLNDAGFETEEQLLIYIGKNPRKLLEIKGFGEVSYKYLLEWLANPKLLKCEARDEQQKLMKKEARQRWENLLLSHFKAYKLRGYKQQFKFDQARLWTFDFAFIEEKLAIEIDGGLFIRGGGGHNTGKGYAKDREKDQAAMLQAWRVYRVTPQMVRKGTAINTILQLLKDNQKASI